MLYSNYAPYGLRYGEAIYVGGVKHGKVLYLR